MFSCPRRWASLWGWGWDQQTESWFCKQERRHRGTWGGSKEEQSSQLWLTGDRKELGSFNEPNPLVCCVPDQDRAGGGTSCRDYGDWGLYMKPTLFEHLLHVVLTKCTRKKKSQVHNAAQWMWRSSQWILCYHQLCLSHWVICWVFHFVKICLSESKWYPKSKVKVMVILASQKGHITCLVEVIKWKFEICWKTKCL
jgi:hypothetical protein